MEMESCSRKSPTLMEAASSNLALVLRQINTIRILSPHFLKISCNIIFPYTPRFSMSFVSFRIMFCGFLIFPKRTTCSIPIILFYLIILIHLEEEYKLGTRHAVLPNLLPLRCFRCTSTREIKMHPEF